MKRKKINAEDCKISKYDTVSLITMGNYKRIKYTSNPHVATNIKIDDKRYFNIASGEVRQYKEKTENRAESQISLKKSFERLKDIIRTNVTNASRIRWCTLTYADNMTDKEQLYKDFHKFFPKVKRLSMREGFGNVDYIVVAEPQARGAWHLHVLFFWEGKAPFIDNAVIEKKWSHGFTQFKAVNQNSMDDIAAYLTAYLTNVEISKESSEYIPEDRLKIVTKDGKTKYFAKGARLNLYPPHMKLYRCSAGIQRPEREDMLMCKALEHVAGMELKYQAAYEMEEDNYSFYCKRMDYQKRSYK